MNLKKLCAAFAAAASMTGVTLVVTTAPASAMARETRLAHQCGLWGGAFGISSLDGVVTHYSCSVLDEDGDTITVIDEA